MPLIGGCTVVTILNRELKMPQRPLSSKANKAGHVKKVAANRHGKNLKTKKGITTELLGKHVSFEAAMSPCGTLCSDRLWYNMLAVGG